jgi:hypothetical protein
MNLRVSNLIAVELAILIALMSWMVFSRSPSAEPRTSPEILESPAEPATTLAHLSEVRKERPATINPSADRARVRPQDQQPIPVPQQYVQQIAPQAYANPVYENAAIPAEAPAYAESYEEPVVAPSDYATSDDSIAYAEPAPVVVYPAPYQIIVFSNPHRFANRRQFHSGAFTTNFPRRAGPRPVSSAFGQHGKSSERSSVRPGIYVSGASLTLGNRL